MTNPAHQALVAKFGDAVRSSDGAAYVWFGSDGTWHAMAETPDGEHTLEKPGGGGFIPLESLLSILAGVGIKRIMVEFNGIPPIYYDRINK